MPTDPLNIEYLVFDYLGGGTLARRLARALGCVHGLGLIHRDVAPGNVWLDEHQRAHLGDFDSVVSRDAALHPDLHPEALPPTTEAYAAPEQLSGRPFDERRARIQRSAGSS